MALEFGVNANGASPFTSTVKVETSGDHFGGDWELAHDFIDVIRGRGTSRTSVAAGIQSAYICLAARESILRSCFVKPRQLGG